MPRQKRDWGCPPPPPDKKVLLPNEAAAVLGVSENEMYNLLHVEGFPGYKLGARWYVSAELLSEWIRERASKHFT